MTTTPLVSVIVPAYQAEPTLGATISSALTQSYAQLEILVCDDGSTDTTADIAGAYGPRVRLVRQDRGGVSAARNALLTEARGELCALLDADDFWFPQYLERAVTTWQRAGAGRRLVTSSAYFLTPRGVAPRRRVLTEVVPPRRQRLRALEGPFVSGFTLFPRALSDEIGGFDTRLRTAEDYDFWLRAVFAGWEVLFQMDPQALYRRSGDSLSYCTEQMHQDEATVFRKLLAESAVVLTPGERDWIDRRLTLGSPLGYIQRGEEALLGGDRRRAAKEFATAADLLPSNRDLRRKGGLLRMPGSTRALAWVQSRRLRQT